MCEKSAMKSPDMLDFASTNTGMDLFILPQTGSIKSASSLNTFNAQTVN